MSPNNRDLIKPAGGDLFDRVTAILEAARASVVRSVNSNTVIAYWLIGREIVQELQKGEKRAGYGEKLLEDLSARLTKSYGKGFSLSNLKRFRQFYMVYQDRDISKGAPLGSQSEVQQKSSPLGSELEARPEKGRPVGSVVPKGFHPNICSICPPKRN